MLERRAKLIELDRKKLAELIAPVLSGRRVEAFSVLSGGYCNTNYRFTVEGSSESFVLRIYARDPGACARELAVMARARTLVPIPEVIHANVEGKGLGLPFLVSRWVAGEPLEKLLPTWDERMQSGMAYQLGSLLARLSEIRFERFGAIRPDFTIDPAGPESFSGALGRMLFRGRAGGLFGRDLTERLWGFVLEHAPFMDSLPGQAVLVHADFNVSNILIRTQGGKTDVQAVLDWEFAHAGHAVSDFCALLRDEDQRAPQFGSELARGFRDGGRSLPEEWRKAVKLFDLITMCEAADSDQERPLAVRRAIGVIERTLMEWSKGKPGLRRASQMGRHASCLDRAHHGE